MANVDDNWEPPSEGEMKILEARRERQDKISKLMGQYLLKGYKMLDAVCPLCQTVLLKTRAVGGKAGVNYCIACNEMDTDVSKDDPVLDPVAARSQVLEKQNRSTPTYNTYNTTSTGVSAHTPTSTVASTLPTTNTITSEGTLKPNLLAGHNHHADHGVVTNHHPYQNAHHNLHNHFSRHNHHCQQHYQQQSPYTSNNPTHHPTSNPQIPHNHTTSHHSHPASQHVGQSLNLISTKVHSASQLLNDTPTDDITKCQSLCQLIQSLAATHQALQALITPEDCKIE